MFFISTVTSTLKLADAFTRPLRNITQALNITISAMQKLHGEADRDSNIAKQFDAAKKKIADADAELRKMAEDIDNANKNQQRFNSSVNSTETAMSKLAKRAAGVVAAYVGLREVKDFFSDLFTRGIDFNAFRQSSEVAFTTFLGDLETARMYMDEVLAFAKTTPFSYPDLLTAGRNMIAFGMEADNTLPILKAIGDATAGIGGGNQELMQIADAFGAIQVSGRLSMQEVNRLQTHGIPALKILANQAGVTAAEMQKRISKGSVGSGSAIAALVKGIEEGTDGLAGATAKFGGLMEKNKGTWVGALDSLSSARRNAGAELMQPFMEPMTGFIKNLTTFFKQIPTYVGPAINVFIPVINALNNAFETGKFDIFLKAVSGGLTIISWLIAGVVRGVIWLAEVVGQYWPVITTFLALWGMTYIPLVITKLGALIPLLYNVGKGWLAALGPVGWGIAIVMTLIGVLKMFGVTTEQIVGFITGTFYTLFTFIRNQVAFVWDLFLSLAEFLVNIFIDPVYAIKKLFYDLFAGLYDYLAGWINMVVDSINWVINAMNRVFDTGISTISKLQSAAVTFGEGPTSSKNVLDLSRFKMGQNDLDDAFKRGYDFGHNLTNDITSGLANAFKMPEFGNLNVDSIGSVGEVGKIRDTVDISSEDLKMMRELAEMQNIQNFVSLTPTVTVQTGDINNGMDIDTIVANITDRLETQIATSARGVYNV